MHINFIRTVLSVKPSTNTFLLYAETGRFPRCVAVYKQIIKYWLKLTCTSDNRYIVVAFYESPSEYNLFVKNCYMKIALSMFRRQKLPISVILCSYDSLNEG